MHLYVRGLALLVAKVKLPPRYSYPSPLSLSLSPPPLRALTLAAAEKVKHDNKAPPPRRTTEARRCPCVPIALVSACPLSLTSLPQHSPPPTPFTQVRRQSIVGISVGDLLATLGTQAFGPPGKATAESGPTHIQAPQPLLAGASLVTRLETATAPPSRRANNNSSPSRPHRLRRRHPRPRPRHQRQRQRQPRRGSFDQGPLP